MIRKPDFCVKVSVGWFVFLNFKAGLMCSHRDTNREKRQKMMSGLEGERWEEGESVSKMSFHGF